jgi:ankyrin repeat protein
MVQYLVERNCDINTQDNNGMRPLDVAVLKCNMKTNSMLLERNASSGITILRIVAAARFGFLDLLKRFVAMGDDINAKADNGESLLHVACKFGYAATVRYLCEHGAVLDWQDNNGNTALHVAAEVGHKEIYRILLNRGASVNVQDKNGKTPLILATEKGGVEIVRELQTAKALEDLLTPH